MSRGARILACWLVLLGAGNAPAQIDPTRRELIQLGYNQPLEGRGPLAAYAFYYLNKPQSFNNSNLTLRLAMAPVYVDSEVGIKQALGADTDLGVGLAGGGFADSYYEVHRGKYERRESFLGHGGEVSSSIYHLFNPDSRIPLHAVLRGATHYAAYTDDSNTGEDFTVPDDQLSFRVRAGLRFGGREPVMMPDLAMELSVWYEGEFRTDPNRYGYNGDREVEPASHRFWARALLNYTFPECKHAFGLNLTVGTSIDPDRFSAYRLGGNLPLYSEFPLSLPGYYFQELTAESFVLVGGTYNLPLDRKQRFLINVTGTSAWVDYLDALVQSGNWNAGLGGGLIFRSPSGNWQVALAYGYGFKAIRDGDRGAQSISLLAQFDWGRARRFFDPSENVSRSGGLQQFFRTIFR